VNQRVLVYLIASGNSRANTRDPVPAVFNVLLLMNSSSTVAGTHSNVRRVNLFLL